MAFRTSLPTLVPFLTVLIGVPTAAGAQDAHPTNFSDALVAAEPVRDALSWLESNFEAQVEEWIRITEIPGTSGMEDARAAYLVAQLEAEGVEVSVDDAGNVIARLPGLGGGPTVVFGAHMDTVHPLDADVTVTRDGDRLLAPGIFDNSASVANMMAALRALKRSGVRTRGDILFIATVEEELGFNGMDHWLAGNPGVADVVVALDGGLGAVAYGALWFAERRYTFRAEGSHTLTSRGKPQPARAVADAIRAIYEIELPEDGPFAVYNVGTLGGGTVTNAIPQEAWFTVDVRSVEPALLDHIDAEMDRRVQAVAGLHGVDLERDPPSRESAVSQATLMLSEPERRAHPLVQTALDVYSHLGLSFRTNDSGSTDAVAAVRLGIPAIAMGRARGGDQHTLSEWADAPSALTATKAVLLVAVSMAGLAPLG